MSTKLLAFFAAIVFSAISVECISLYSPYETEVDSSSEESFGGSEEAYPDPTLVESHEHSSETFNSAPKPKSGISRVVFITFTPAKSNSSPESQSEKTHDYVPTYPEGSNQYMDNLMHTLLFKKLLGKSNVATENSSERETESAESTERPSYNRDLWSNESPDHTYENKKKEELKSLMKRLWMDMAVREMPNFPTNKFSEREFDTAESYATTRRPSLGRRVYNHPDTETPALSPKLRNSESSPILRLFEKEEEEEEERKQASRAEMLDSYWNHPNAIQI